MPEEEKVAGTFGNNSEPSRLRFNTRQDALDYAAKLVKDSNDVARKYRFADSRNWREEPQPEAQQKAPPEAPPAVPLELPEELPAAQMALTRDEVARKYRFADSRNWREEPQPEAQQKAKTDAVSSDHPWKRGKSNPR